MAKRKRKIKIRRAPKAVKKVRKLRVRRSSKPKTRRVKIVRLPKPTAQTPRKKIRVIKSKGANKNAKAVARQLGKRLGERIAETKQEAKKPAATFVAQEWLVNFIYTNTGRSVDFIAVAFSAKDALKFVRAELRKTEAGRRLLQNFKPRVYQYRPPHLRDVSDIGEVIER